MKKNLFFTFCFSFIPGAGQMYQDYMKRGISLMILFGIFVGIYAMVGIPIFLIPVPIMYAYSFFDTYNLRNKIGTDKEIQDKAIWEELGLEEFKNNKLNKSTNTFLGVILIFVGAYLVFNSILKDIGIRYDIYYLKIFSSYVLRYLPSVIIATLSIWVGIKLVINKK